MMLQGNMLVFFLATLKGKMLAFCRIILMQGETLVFVLGCPKQKMLASCKVLTVYLQKKRTSCNERFERRTHLSRC